MASCFLLTYDIRALLGGRLYVCELCSEVLDHGKTVRDMRLSLGFELVFGNEQPIIRSGRMELAAAAAMAEEVRTPSPGDGNLDHGDFSIC